MRVVSLLFIALLAACSTSKPSLFATSANDITYQQLTQYVDQFQHEMVRWGGVIVDVENAEDRARLTVVHFPLTRYGKPITSENSDGRFVVLSERFLDPIIYSKGKLITVIGQVDGFETQQVDRRTLTLPIILLQENHLWPENYAEGSRVYNPKHDAPFLGYGYYGTGSYSP